MSWLDLRLHHVSGLPRLDSTTLVRVLGLSSCSRTCVGGISFLGAWLRANVSAEEVQFEVHWSPSDCEERESQPRNVLVTAGRLQLQGGAGWLDAEVALQWHPGHRELAEAADVESDGCGDEEGMRGLVRGPRLRISYCVSPALGVGAQVGPELGGMPLELPIVALPQRAHTYAHGGFMGAAASMMADSRWKAILEREDPDSFKKANELYTKLLWSNPGPNRELVKLMGVLENSPVLCAYGLVLRGCIVPAALRPGSAAAPSGKRAHTACGTSAADGTHMPAPGAHGGVQSHHRQQQQQRSPQLTTYVASLGNPNAFGYLPISLEWDLWIHPKQPQDLNLATVDHGTAIQLVTQAITTAVPGLKSIAKKAGVIQIDASGISPIFWLNALGHAINQAVNGDRAAPLPLAAQEEMFYRLSLEVLRLQGGVAAPGTNWEELSVKAWADIPSMVLPALRTRGSDAGSGACWWNEGMQFWPLPVDLGETDIVFEVQGFAKRGEPWEVVASVRMNLLQVLCLHPELVRGKTLIEVRLNLQQLLYQHPQLVRGKARIEELSS